MTQETHSSRLEIGKVSEIHVANHLQQYLSSKASRLLGLGGIHQPQEVYGPLH